MAQNFTTSMCFDIPTRKIKQSFGNIADVKNNSMYFSNECKVEENKDDTGNVRLPPID